MNRTTLRALSGLASSTRSLASGEPGHSAQSDDLLVRYYMDPGYAGEGMPYRDCSLGDSFEADEPAPRSRRGSTRSRSPVRTHARKRPRTFVSRKHVELEALIGELDNLLGTMPPDYPNRPDILFRKAEALKELSDADYLVARSDASPSASTTGTPARPTRECYEPMPDYTEAIEAYRSIARNHPVLWSPRRGHLPSG